MAPPKSPSQTLPTSGSNRLWLQVASGLELAFTLAFVFWLMLALQDWLLSPLDPYPYRASAFNGLAAIAGLTLFLRARRPVFWRDVAVGVATLVMVCGAWGFAPFQGSIVSLGSLVCGLTTPPLLLSFLAQKKLTLRDFWRLSLFLIAAMALIYRASTSQDLIWGALVTLAATGVSGLGVLLARSRQTSEHSRLSPGWAAGSLLLFAGFSALCFTTIWPGNLPPTADFWQGEGFGKNSFPLYWRGAAAFAPLVAREQGVLALWILVLMFAAALAAGMLVIFQAIANQSDPEAVIARQISTELGCGALGALAGMLVGARFAPPFLTLDSIGGSWALSLALCSLGIAAAPRRVGGEAPRAATKSPSGSAKKPPFFKTAIALLLLFAMAWSWNLSRAVVQPFAGEEKVDGIPNYVRLSEVSPPMRDATVAMEDARFYEHHGIDWAAMHRALRVNLRQGRVRQGGSTLTQQLAKNLFLSPERTVTRKIKEAALTLELERQLPKTRILEIYLNVINYGMKQRGIGAAARYYFHKTPAQLTLAESAFLVGLVPRPPQKKLVTADLASGSVKALERITGLWPQRYSPEQVQEAERTPIYRLVYPFKTAWDRGATDQIPAQWQGVSFYYAPISETEARPIYNVAPILKPPLAAFLTEARARFEVVGISHIGIYDDRPVRGLDSVLSSHAFGQALDIAGFHFADGSSVRVKDHRDPRVAARLLPLGALLRGHFDAVVDWRDDPKRHDDHFHAEIKARRDSAPRAPFQVASAH